MLSLPRQIAAVVRMNVKGLPDRLWSSLATVAALALTVAVLLGFLALGTGIGRALTGAGSDRVALVLSRGSPDESASQLGSAALDVLSTAPGIVQRGDRPVISAERFVIVKGVRKSGEDVNLAIRGIGPAGLAVRPGLAIVRGRAPTPGSNEMLVGAALAREFDGFVPGRTIRLGGTSWSIVGVFEQGGSVTESEALVSLDTLQNFYRSGPSFQAARVLLTDPGALAGLAAALAADSRAELDAVSEQAYLARQAEGVGSALRALGWPLAILMSIGALAGALNTMYASVAERQREVATLRAIGFSPVSAFVGTLAESLVLALAGAVLGAALAALLFNGLETSTLGANFNQIVFRFGLSGQDYAAAVMLALIVGLIGGLAPAWRAARTPPAAAQSL